MRNTFDLAFYCRKSKMNQKGLAPIELAISVNGRRNFINLPITMNPDYFEKKLAAKKNNEVKEYLANVEEKIKNFQLQRVSAGQNPTMEQIMKYVKCGFCTDYMEIPKESDPLVLFST